MKKWTFLLAAGLLAGATPVFTGCIDNDEPEGITILRGAKAELLKAKAAVEAAKVAQVEADAAFKKAQAAVEEAKVLKIQAEAEKVKAEAEIAKAEAAYWNARSEQERAAAQATIEENERKQKEWEEKAAVRAAQAEAAIKEAEYRALQAKADYETALVTLIGAKQYQLKPYIAEVESKTTAWHNALDKVLEATRALADLDLEKADREEYKELYTRDLKWKLQMATAELAGAEEAKKEAEAALADAEKLTQSPLVDKLEEVKAKQEKVLLELADLNAQAEEVRAKYIAEGRFDEVVKLMEAAAKAFYEEEITLPAVEFDFGDGAGFPFGFRGVHTILEERTTTLSDFSMDQDIESLKNWLNEFDSMAYDEDGNEWTKEYEAKLKYEIEELGKEEKVLKAAWLEAVNAYHTNDYIKIDPTKISDYAALKDNLDKTVNPAIVELNKVVKNVAELKKQQKDDENTKLEAVEDNAKECAAAKKIADDKQVADMAKLPETIKANQKTKDDALKAAKDEVAAQEKALEDYMKTDKPDVDKIAAYERLIKLAKEKEATAQKAADDYRVNGEQIETAAINKAHKDAIAAAEKTQDDKDKAAVAAYDAKWDAKKGTQALALEAANKDKDAKWKDLMTVKLPAAKDLAETFNTNNPDLGATVVLTDLDKIAAEVKYLDDKKVYAYNEYQAFDMNTLLPLNKAGLEAAVRSRSLVLFGSERLTDLTDAQIKAEVEEKVKSVLEADETLTPDLYMYETFFYTYGAVGDRLAKEEKLRIVSSWLTNSELITAKQTQTLEAIKAIETAKKAQEDKYAAAFDAAVLASDKLIADLDTSKAPIVEKQKELEPLRVLYDAYYNQILGYISAGVAIWTEEQINEQITWAKQQLAAVEEQVYNAETAKMQAEKDLADWESNAAEWDIILQRNLEDAKTAEARAKEALDKAQATLDAMIASLSAE